MRTLLTRPTRDAQSRWALDPDFSAVEFTVPHLGIGYLRGRFHDVALQFDFTMEAPGAARLELCIGPESIGSGTHAWVPLAADVFSVGGFGAIRFTGHTAEPIGPRRLALHGELAIRGAALPATMELVLRGEATDCDGVHRLGLGGSLVFSRRAFGIRWSEPQDAALGDEMRIAIDAELVRAEEPPSAA
jgi:polyisoprenoid-binding protein YceI